MRLSDKQTASMSKGAVSRSHRLMVALSYCLLALAAYPAFASHLVSTAHAQEALKPTEVAVELLKARQLRSQPMTVTSLPEAEVERVILAWLRRQQPGDEALRFTRALAALGCVPCELDPLPLRARVLTLQIGGWYDAERNAVVIVDSSTNPPPAAKPNVPRAIAFGLLLRQHGSTLLPPAGERFTTDMRLARDSLLAGDASLTVHLFSQRHPDAAPEAGLPADDPGHPVNKVPMPPYLIELDALPFAHGFACAQALHRAGNNAQLDAAYSCPPVSTAEIIGHRRHRDPAGAASQSRIVVTSETLNGAAPFWDDELGQFACLTFLRTQNRDEDALLGTRGLVADRLLAWEAKGAKRHHAAWQTLWQGTEHAAAFEDAITKVIVERYGVITRSGEGFTFNARGRHVSLSRNRNSLGVLLLDTADADTLQALATMLEEPQATAK